MLCLPMLCFHVFCLFVCFWVEELIALVKATIRVAHLYDVSQGNNMTGIQIKISKQEHFLLCPGLRQEFHIQTGKYKSDQASSSVRLSQPRLILIIWPAAKSVHFFFLTQRQKIICLNERDYSAIYKSISCFLAM